MAFGPTRGSLRRPPRRTLDPLNPEAILEDAEKLPILARNVNNLREGLGTGKITPEAGRRLVAEQAQALSEDAAGIRVEPGQAPVATPEAAAEPVAKFDSRTPKEREQQQNAFRAVFNDEEPPARQRLASLLKPPPNGRTAPTVVGPAQRAVAEAIDKTGADLPRPDALPKSEFPLVPIGEVTGQRFTPEQAQARAKLNQDTALAARAAQSASNEFALRSVQPDADPSIAAGNALRVASGEGGGLFATGPDLIALAERAEQQTEVPQGEGFEPIRNLFRGLAAGGLGLGESTGTILRYLGGETGLESVAALGENIEGFFQPRMRKFVERASQTFRSDQNILENPELLLDLDFLTFTIGQIVPSLLATITPVGLTRAAVRKVMLNKLGKTAGAVAGAVGSAAEGERVAIAAKQVAGLTPKVLGQGAAANGTISRFVKIGNSAIDLADPDVMAKLARIGKAATVAGLGAGGLAGGALEGSSTYRETLDTLIEQGVPENIARETAENAFLMMTAGSGVLNSVGLRGLIKLFDKQVSGVKARALIGLQEAVTEYLEGPLEAGIQLGQETITVEQAIQKMKDETNVLPAAFITGFLMPGAGGAFGQAHDRTKPPAQEAADATQEDEPGELPPVDPGAGAAGQAVNVIPEEASGTAQAEAEEVDETTVQEPDEGEAATDTGKPSPAKDGKAKPTGEDTGPAATPARPDDEVVTEDDLVTEPEPGPEDEGDVEPEPTPEELAFDEETAEPTADDLLNARAALSTDEDGEFEITKQTVAQLKVMADEFGVKKTGNKAAIVTRITDAAAELVSGRDTQEAPSAQAIPETEDQVQTGRTVTESVGGESSQDIQQPVGRAERSKKADRKGDEQRTAKAKPKVKPKAAAKKPAAKTTEKKREAEVEEAFESYRNQKQWRIDLMTPEEQDALKVAIKTQKELPTEKTPGGLELPNVEDRKAADAALTKALSVAVDRKTLPAKKPVAKATKDEEAAARFVIEDLTSTDQQMVKAVTQHTRAEIDRAADMLGVDKKGTKRAVGLRIQKASRENENLRGPKNATIAEQGEPLDTRVQTALDTVASKELNDEVEFLTETQRESEGGETDLYTALQDAEQKAENDGDRKLLKAARQAQIELGVYAPVTDEQLANTQTTGKNKFAFQLGGVKYDFVGHPSAIEVVDEFFSAEASPAPSTREDGRVRLTHFTKQSEITEIDPQFHGTGIRGAEGKRKRSNPDTYQDRIYYGLNVGEEGGYKPEPGLRGQAALESSVDPAKLYDMRNDPDGLKDGMDRGVEFFNLYETAIKDAGYVGYYVDNVAAVFRTRPVEAVNESVSERIERISKEPEEDVPIDGDTFFSGDSDAQSFNIGESEKAIDIISRDEESGTRISYMGAFKRAFVNLPLEELENALQIKSASVKGSFQNQGIGQQLIEKMHMLALERGMTLVSDSVVSTEQIRAYMGLRRKGWEIVFADEQDVQKALDKHQETGVTEYVAMIDVPVVIGIRSPKQVDDELSLGTAQDVLFSAQGNRVKLSQIVDSPDTVVSAQKKGEVRDTNGGRIDIFIIHRELGNRDRYDNLIRHEDGRVLEQSTGGKYKSFHSARDFGKGAARKYAKNTPVDDAKSARFSADGKKRGATSERVQFTKEEKKQIERVVAKVPAGQEQATRDMIRSDRQKFAPSEGWERMVPTGVTLGTRGKAKGTVTSIKYKGIAYTFEKDPTTGKAYTTKKVNQKRKARRQKHLAREMVKRVREVEKAAKRGAKWAKEIMAQRAWYTAVTARLRTEFGGASDLIADLLGATSPKTPVAQNFTQTMDAARQLSEGKFDTEMLAFIEHLDAGGRPSKYKGPTVTKINGKKYGTNTISTMQAMARVWRVVRPGMAPKARNFTGNLIGISDAATIDVWAARFMERLAAIKRVPPKAEGAVGGNVGADGVRIGGAFGFAQDVFDIAAEELGMTPKDLQAVAWFMEKKEWNDNKWSTEEAAGGSFEQQLDLRDLSRLLSGISVQKKRKPTDKFQNKIATRIRRFFQADSDSVSFRSASTMGQYEGDVERAFDVEATVTPDFDVNKFVAEMAQIGKENKQTDVFVSRVLSPTANNLNARPGIEVYFKNESDIKSVQPILDSLVADGVDGFTMVVDPRASITRTRSGETFIGVRYQFVPEIKARYDTDFVADVRKRGMDVILGEETTRLTNAAVKLMSLGAVDYQIFQYDTVVFGKENYDEYTGSNRATNQTDGRVWFGQSIDRAFEAAVSRHQEGEGAAAPGGVRGSVQQTAAGAVDGGSDTTTQTTPARQSTAGQISAAADNNLAGDASEVAAPARPASAADGAVALLTAPTADDAVFSADDRLSTVTDPKDRGKKPKTPLNADRVRFHLLEIINRLSPLINIRIVQSHSDLPNSIQLRMKRDKIHTVRGVYMPSQNTLYIVADSAVSLAGAERTMLHEMFGHFAMSSMPKFANIKARLQKIIDSQEDQVVNRLVKSVKAKGHVSGDQFLDEVIAEMSETMTSRNAVMKEVIATVKEMVRSLGFSVELSNTDMMALIRASRRRIERRALAAAGLGIDRNSEKYEDFLKSDQLRNLRNAGTNLEVGIALEGLAKEFDAVMFSASSPMTPELDAEWEKKMNTPFREMSWPDRMRKSMQIFHDMSFAELTQGLIDSANATKTNEIAAYGSILDASVSASKAMSTIRNMNNVMGAVMRHGIPSLKEAFVTLADGTKVKGLNFTNPKDGQAFQEIWTPLQKIGGDSQLRNWEKWMVATRAGSLIAKDLQAGRLGSKRREKLIEQQLVDQTLQWARDQTAEDGTTYEEIFKEVQANWVKVNKANLDLAVQTGVIDAKERAIWESYDYVPFWREMSGLESGHPPGHNSRTDVSSAGLFRLTGKVDEDGSPTKLEGNVVDSMFMNTAYLLERSYRNEAHRRTVDAALKTGAYVLEPQPARPQRIPSTKAADLIKMMFHSGMINAATEEDAVAVFDTWSKAEQDKWLTFFNRVAPQGPNIVTLMVKGKPVYYRVTDRLLLKSIVGMQGKNIGMWMSAMRTSKKWLTIGVTTDPAFMLANWMRDTVQTFIVSKAPLHSLADPIKSLHEAYNDSPAMLALAYAGRGGGGFYDTNPEKIRDLLKDMEVPGHEIDGFMNTIISPRKIVQWWKRVGTASEFSNRVRVYNSLKLVWDRRIAELGQQGIKGQAAKQQAVSEGLASPEEAAYQAQDLLNFTRSGDFVAIQNLIQIVPFLNARIQGINKLWRGAKESPMSFAMKGGALAAASLSLAIANDDDDRYNALPEWDRDTYYHFWIQGEHWRLPKPFESGVLFSTIPERIWRAGKGIDGWDEFSRSMLHAALDTFAFNPIPQLAKPAIESYFNTNIFTSTPIIPAGMENMLPQRQYDWRTGEFARWVGDAMPDFMPDVMQSPKRIEHLMRGYFGALGVYTMSVANVMTDSILHGPERALGELGAMKLHELPVLKRFKQADVPHTTKYNRILWEQVRESDAIARTLKTYIEEGEGQRALGLAHNEAQILALRPTLRRVATEVSKVNKQINQVSLDRRLSPEKRTALRDKLLEKRNALTAQVEPLLEYL